MNQAVRIPQSAESKWSVVAGPMKGTVRLLNIPRFMIGRSPDCEFVIINDPKVSRQHAMVQVSLNGYEIKSMNERNLITINGQEREQAILRDGDVITFGETKVQFNITTLPQQMVVQGPGHAQVPVSRSYAEAVPSPGAHRRPSRPRTRSSGQGPSKRLLIYGLVGLFFAGIFLLDGEKKKKAKEIRTEQQIQADIEAANKIREIGDAVPQKIYSQNPAARQGHEHYLRGFRDYNKGQFERALESFQSCLALYPDHALCARYYRLAQRRFNELVQYQIVQGRKQRDQNQFQACRASFKNVMTMVKDVSSQTFREAKANYEACNNMVEGRY